MIRIKGLDHVVIRARDADVKMGSSLVTLYVQILIISDRPQIICVSSLSLSGRRLIGLNGNARWAKTRLDDSIMETLKDKEPLKTGLAGSANSTWKRLTAQLTF